MSSARAIRRAAERLAAKQARKPGLAADPARQSVPPAPSAAAPAITLPVLEELLADPTSFDFKDEEDDEMSIGSSSKPPVSDRRVAANQKNAEASTGARTPAGKKKVSLNALKTGLTSQLVVMPFEDLAEYRQYLERRFEKYQPANDDENILAQTIIDNEWRLARIAPLEAAVFALGYRAFAAEFADEDDPNIRAALINGRTQMEYRRDLSNLALQERRLRNHIENDVERLNELQKERHIKRKTQIDWCIKLQAPEREGPAFQPSTLGFDFSAEELNAYLAENAPEIRLTGRYSNFDLFLIAYRTGHKQAEAA